MSFREGPFLVIWLVRKREPELELVWLFFGVFQQLVVEQDIAERMIRVDETDLSGIAGRRQNLLDQLKMRGEAWMRVRESVRR